MKSRTKNRKVVVEGQSEFYPSKILKLNDQSWFVCHVFLCKLASDGPHLIHNLIYVIKITTILTAMSLSFQPKKGIYFFSPTVFSFSPSTNGF